MIFDDDKVLAANYGVIDPDDPDPNIKWMDKVIIIEVDKGISAKKKIGEEDDS